MSDRLSIAVAGLLHALLALWLLAVVVPKVERRPRIVPAVAVELVMLEPSVSENEDAPADVVAASISDPGEPAPVPVPRETRPEPQASAAAPVVSQARPPVVDIAPRVASQPEVQPAPQPAPTVAPVTVKRRTFDANGLSALLDRAAPIRKKPVLRVGELSSLLDKSLPQGAARLNAFQAASLEASIRAQITPCWNFPTAPDGAGNIIVLLKIQLRPDGGLERLPEVLSIKGVTAATAAYGRAMASSVKRAVSLCSPLKLPAEHYESWREIELNFDPSQVL